ncbi:hypothetical protein SAMN02745116_00778 [Pilibacter termitis]|uniref:Uncharacterized protein n=2 Tax=Pilibacter termitis TaxID=263852 RepID=A0A1T4LRF0_9ENTE|nr:hypothetical protein SAMN02745116_00778 [Pilibacter termitis]
MTRRNAITNEIDNFFNEVHEAEIEVLQSEIKSLKAQLSEKGSSQATPISPKVLNIVSRERELENRVKALEEENRRLRMQMQLPKISAEPAEKEQIADVLLLAQAQAREIQRRAEIEAEQMKRSAQARILELQKEGDVLHAKLSTLLHENNETLKKLISKSENWQ